MKNDATKEELQAEVNRLNTLINDNQKALADANRRLNLLNRLGAIDDQEYYSFQNYLAALEIT